MKREKKNTKRVFLLVVYFSFKTRRIIIYPTMLIGVISEAVLIERKFTSFCKYECSGVQRGSGMANFDDIFEENIEEDEQHSRSSEDFVPCIPDPIVIRGVGSMTV